MHPANGGSLKRDKIKGPLFRSVFNREFRSSVRYSSENRYKLYRQQSEASSIHSETSREYSALPKSSSKASVSKVEDNETEKSNVKEHSAYVGFANLPNQIYSKAIQKGFEFTLMVVGAAGLGKSTLVNSMFEADIYHPGTHPGPSARIKKTVSVETTRVSLREGGVNLTLTLVDTPGFGDAVNNDKCWTPIINFIEDKHDDFFTSESKVNRKTTQDQRVHCCLYFIQPSGHALKELDIEFMRRLSDKVNIIPVIAKGDTLTPEECAPFKRQILQDIEDNDIKIYKFPDVSVEDEEYEWCRSIKKRVPFAVAASNTIVEVNGKHVRGRKYPWGVVDITSLKHCDFIALRKMLISTHMLDLKDTTHNVHYENYRCRKMFILSKEKNLGNPILEIEKEKRNHELQLTQTKTDMEKVLMARVKEIENQLKDSEKLLSMRYETSRKVLEEEAKELESRRTIFELEKQVWMEDTATDRLHGSRESIRSTTDKRRRSFLGNLIFTKNS